MQWRVGGRRRSYGSLGHPTDIYIGNGHPIKISLKINNDGIENQNKELIPDMHSYKGVCNGHHLTSALQWLAVTFIQISENDDGSQARNDNGFFLSTFFKNVRFGPYQHRTRENSSRVRWKCFWQTEVSRKYRLQYGDIRMSKSEIKQSNGHLSKFWDELSM